MAVNKSKLNNENEPNFKESAIADLEFDITNFHGPIPLLLTLIKSAKLEIEDVFLDEITDQYLLYMSQVDRLQMDEASEFITVAAFLLEMKTKAMLPPVIDEAAAAADEDDKRQFIDRMREYELYREASDKLKENEQVGICYRKPDESVGQPRLILGDMSTEGLVLALQKMFLKLDQKQESNKTRTIKRDMFTIEDKQKLIRERLSVKSSVMFDDLFTEDKTKTEVITTFQALLELLKLQEAYAIQENVFDPIIICRANKENAL